MNMEDIILDKYDEFMNKHVMNQINIDYRDLIHRGLALEAPEGMYKTE